MCFIFVVLYFAFVLLCIFHSVELTVFWSSVATYIVLFAQQRICRISNTNLLLADENKRYKKYKQLKELKTQLTIKHN